LLLLNIVMITFPYFLDFRKSINLAVKENFFSSSYLRPQKNQPTGWFFLWLSAS